MPTVVQDLFLVVFSKDRRFQDDNKKLLKTWSLDELSDELQAVRKIKAPLSRQIRLGICDFVERLDLQDYVVFEDKDHICFSLTQAVLDKVDELINLDPEGNCATTTRRSSEWRKQLDEAVSAICPNVLTIAERLKAKRDELKAKRDELLRRRSVSVAIQDNHSHFKTSTGAISATSNTKETEKWRKKPTVVEGKPRGTGAGRGMKGSKKPIRFAKLRAKALLSLERRR